MIILKNFTTIKQNISLLSNNTNLIVVTKNQDVSKIEPLINLNHNHFGENRVQEATLKWTSILKKHSAIKLHLIGKLQSNKVKDAFRLFHYIHTLDNEKLAQLFAKFESESQKKINYFIQINIGNEIQKNGISIDKSSLFIKYCIQDLRLNIVGLMCIPPLEGDPNIYFKSLAKIARSNNLSQLSMGMSNDYECAIQNGSTFVRVGSKIFNEV